MGLLISCSLVLGAALYWPSSVSYVAESIATNVRQPALMFAAWQTHMPTKHGDVPHLNQEEQIDPKTQFKAKLDPVQLQREAQELLELSQSLQTDIESVNRGMLPKDTTEKLKRIQKLAKHLRGEIEP